MVNARIYDGDEMVFEYYFQTKTECYEVMRSKLKEYTLPHYREYEEDYALYFGRPFYRYYEQSLFIPRAYSTGDDVEMIITPIHITEKKAKNGRVVVVQKCTKEAQKAKTLRNKAKRAERKAERQAKAEAKAKALLESIF